MKTFKDAIRTRDFALCAELKLDSHSDAAAVISQAKALSDFVDAVQVTDNPGGRVHLSPLAACSILLQEGFDPVMHITCRDRNRIALRSDLLGAAAIGVTSLLIRRGEKPAASSELRAKTVYDQRVKGLIADARSMQTKPPFDRPVDFLIGSFATAFKPNRGWTPQKIRAKADSGVNFIQTQLCFDADVLRHYVARLIDEKIVQRIDIVVGIAPLPSADVGQWLGKKLRGAVLPRKVIKRLRQAKDQELEGIRICAELLNECVDMPGISGVSLKPLGETDGVIEAVRMAGIRT